MGSCKGPQVLVVAATENAFHLPEQAQRFGADVSLGSAF